MIFFFFWGSQKLNAEDVYKNVGGNEKGRRKRRKPLYCIIFLTINTSIETPSQPSVAGVRSPLTSKPRKHASSSHKRVTSHPCVTVPHAESSATQRTAPPDDNQYKPDTSWILTTAKNVVTPFLDDIKEPHTLRYGPIHTPPAPSQASGSSHPLFGDSAPGRVKVRLVLPILCGTAG